MIGVARVFVVACVLVGCTTEAYVASDAGLARDAAASDDATTATDGSAADGGDGATAPTSDAAPGTIRLVQVQRVPIATNNTATVTIDVTAGSLLVVATYLTATSSTAVADARAQAWKSALESSNGSCANTASAHLLYVENAVGGSDTITVTQVSMAGQYLGFTVLEYAGAATSNALDGQTSHTSSTASNAVTAGTITTTSAGDVVVALFADSLDVGEMTAGAGFTSRAVDALFYAMVEDRTVVAASASDVPAQLPAGKSDACWVGVAAAFRAAR